MSIQQDNEYSTPDWAKHVIWYQVFPERFCNGDPSNDPTAERLGMPEDWEISPWTGDWYEQAPWEKEYSDTFRKSVYKRRYGGDLQGVLDKLDYLEELGIGGIYLNPVFDAVSLHKYDASYYHHVDRFFGPDPEGDAQIMEQEDPSDPSTWQWTSADKMLLKLIEEVHERGMRIILDGVFNHTGTDFWAFRDVLEHQQDSQFKDWYAVQSFEDPSDPESEFLYDSWWGVKSLPALKEEGKTLVAPVKEHIFEITRRWMDPDSDGDPSDGIDGWRLDVPEEIGKEFWKEWNELVTSINPEVFTVGEIWTKKSRKWVTKDLFSSSMNYPFTNAVIEYMVNESVKASEFLKELRNLRRQFPKDARFVLQNLMDSHDTPRLASMIVNSDLEFGEETKPKEGFKVRKPNIEERRVQRLIALLQYTYVGAPMIYYGTEAGMWGADDPDDRKPMVWPEHEYDPEKEHPLDKERPADDNNFDRQLFEWYKKLGAIRNAHLPLRIGEFQELAVDNARNHFCFARILNQKMFCIVAINRSDRTQKVSIPLSNFDIPENNHLENLVTGTRINVKDEQATLTLSPVTGAILSPENR
ncbi:glycoside hydrolase family 13 protein [Fodinibius halophilus]|uniref:Alpha-amylase n=1 Tax=Fodinibius halophilus TaxID=1736908 RepID=A0A6M1SU40_9BACT|nr:glycoside hydrolase family 13 protein [Fodinibius halophilus]NGP87026.1 alpha-amylase [Fodinibius halophilus]